MEGKGLTIIGPVQASVVVLNWNGANLVLECLASIMALSPAPEKIIVVDNGSTDASLTQIERRFPKVKVIKLERNIGFAAGMNMGINAVTSDFVLLLNLDIVVRPDYLGLCLEALSSDPKIGGVTGKLLRPGATRPATLDSTGHLVYRSRRAVDRGELELDEGQYDWQKELFSVCGAAPCYRMEMLRDISVGGQYFDEDFFAYFEDFDLSWRAKLRGWRFRFVPQATAVHKRSASGAKASTFILACNHRNRLLVMLRNDDRRMFLRHLPGIVYTELRASLFMLGLRPAALPLAWGQFFRLLPKQWKKRKVIHASRTVSVKSLEPWFEPYRFGWGATVARARRRARAR